MKSRLALAALTTLALVAAASALDAQGGQGPGPGPGRGAGQGQGPGRHAGGPPAYDLAAETTLTGKVAELLPQACACGGLHLRLATASGDVEVALGPTTYLAEMGASFMLQDELQITGAKPANGAPADFLARSVRKGDATYELRDAAGLPRWAGAGKACPMHKSGAAGQAG